jgi:gamma-glutamylputrescine oxidase
MERPWGDAPWRRIPVPTAPFPSGTVEIAILGGGLTGVSAAYHLARMGARPVLFEADAIGGGASGRTGGIVLQGTARGPEAGTAHTVETTREIVEREAIDCDLRTPGCWEIEHGAGGEDDALPWNDGGRPVRIVRTVEGGAVDPGGLLEGMTRAAIRAGALFYEHCPVRALMAEALPRLVFDRTEIAAQWVIASVNAWSSELLGIDEVESALTYACATEPLASQTLREIGLADGMPFYTVDRPYLWGRLFADRQVIFGSGLTFGSAPELEALSCDSSEFREMLRSLQERVRKLHPLLNRIGFANAWAGPIAFMDRMAPILGPMAHAPRILVAGAYAGHGVALGVWAGQQLAAYIVQGVRLPPWGSLAGLAARRV